MRLLRPAALAVSLLLAACGSTPTAPSAGSASDVASQWLAQATAISEGDDTAARAKAITRRLDALGIDWHGESFTSGEHAGTNILADVGGPANAPLLLIGAHHDRVEKGRGATDNASGSAAALQLAAALRARPLPNHRVQVAFWDLEELGLLGSKAHVASEGREKPALYVNFDVFGWGDTLWMMLPATDAPLAAEIRAAAKANTQALSAGDKYPPTDHLAFLQAGWPAVSFSLVGGDEIDGILRMYAREKLEQPPKVMRIIHSGQDTAEQLEATHVPRALKTVEDALRAWDAAQ